MFCTIIRFDTFPLLGFNNFYICTFFSMYDDKFDDCNVFPFWIYHCRFDKFYFDIFDLLHFWFHNFCIINSLSREYFCVQPLLCARHFCVCSDLPEGVYGLPYSPSAGSWPVSLCVCVFFYYRYSGSPSITKVHTSVISYNFCMIDRDINMKINL